MLKNFILRLLSVFYPLVKRWLPFEVYAYLAVGAANTALNIGLFMCLYLALAHTWLAVEIATTCSFIITVYTGFWLHKNIAFTHAGNEKKELRQQLGKYALVALQGQLSAYLLTRALMSLLNMNATMAYVVTTIVMLTLNYFLQKHFTFRKNSAIVS